MPSAGEFVWRWCFTCKFWQLVLPWVGRCTQCDRLLGAREPRGQS